MKNKISMANIIAANLLPHTPWVTAMFWDGSIDSRSLDLTMSAWRRRFE